MKLYEIDKALVDVIETGYSVDEDTGEILFEPTDLEQLQVDREQKLEGCALYLKGLKADIEAMQAEKTKLEARIRSKQRKADRMANYIITSLMFMGQNKFETARVELRTRKSTFVDIWDAKKIPLDFIVRKMTEAPDKKAIAAAIKAGEEVPGADMAERVSLTLN